VFVYRLEQGARVRHVHVVRDRSEEKLFDRWAAPLYYPEVPRVTPARRERLSAVVDTSSTLRRGVGEGIWTMTTYQTPGGGR
jgi:hypothetical protein